MTGLLRGVWTIFSAVIKFCLVIILLGFVLLYFLFTCHGREYSDPVWLEAGEYVEKDGVGRIYFFRIDNDNIVLKRDAWWGVPLNKAESSLKDYSYMATLKTDSHWVISVDRVEHSVGNHNYLEVLKVDRSNNRILVQMSVPESCGPMAF